MQDTKKLHADVGTATFAKPPPQIMLDLIRPTGVSFNGTAPWDIQVYDDDVYRRILTRGSLGFGETYMAGMWDSEALDELFTRLLSTNIDVRLVGWARWYLWFEVIRHHLLNLQSLHRAYQVGEAHYDLGNDVFEAMLDPTMSYSCGYWLHADTLEQAQLNKLDMICRKLELKAGEKLLDVGCGWGGLARHAAENYAVEVVGVTVSREQQKLAQERCKGLPVRIELMDYRSLQGSFDKVASVGMFEHVGLKNYRLYFDTLSRLLASDGLLLLHTIGSHKSLRYCDPWIGKYIFINGKLPSAAQISMAIEDRFLIEDWHNFGPDYDRTLLAWWQRFNAAWPNLKHKYDARFYRMWKYYLLSCAGYFRSRQGQLWQLVLSKRERKMGYRSIR